MKIGLVLSGGMAKGAYQIGALRAIDKFIPKEEIFVMSCASIGVLNGYAYATNKLDIAEEIWKNVSENNARYYINKILKSNLLQFHINNLYDTADVINHKFYGTLLDVGMKRIVYKNIGDVREEEIKKYLLACVSLPVYNRSININGNSYYDGAMIDNIPVYPLLDHDLDYIICIYFDDTTYKFENKNFNSKVIKVTFPCANALKSSVVISKESIHNMIEEGYYRTFGLLNSIFYKGYQDLDTIYRAIESQDLNKEKSIRVTGDVVVSNINKVMQKLIKKNII